MTNTSTTYQRCRCISRADCAWLDDEICDEPCWGQVTVESAFEVTHYCEGHAGVIDGGKYRPEPLPDA